MEDSAFDALYTGTYVLVFIIALTITLYLFNSIIDFSDLAYEFNTKVEDNSTIIDAPVEANRLLSGEEVLSYYYNYVKHDLYTEKVSPVNYNVNIQIGRTTNELAGMSLYEVSKAIGMDNKFILRYKGAQYDANGVKNIDIDIVKATQEQIDALV